MNSRPLWDSSQLSKGRLLAVLGGAGGSRRVWTVLLAASVEGVLLAASVGITLSPPASVVVLLKSDFLAYYC